MADKEYARVNRSGDYANRCVVKTIQSPCRIFLAKPEMKGPRFFMSTPLAD